MPNENGDFNLSCGQRFLATRIFSKSVTARPLQRIYYLNEDFNEEAFAKAVQLVVGSHPALRLQLILSNEGWKQRFTHKGVVISKDKVWGINKLSRNIFANLLIAEEVKKILDLTRDPPVKIKLIKVNEGSLLSVCIDHLAVDEISYDLFEKELLHVYNGMLNKKIDEPALQDTFLNFIEREVRQYSIEQENLRYWQHHLKDAPLTLNAKVKKKFKVAKSFYYDITEEPFKNLVSFCHQKKCSIFHLLIAFQLHLLGEAGGIDDVVLGIPVSNRISKDDQNIIGNIVMPIYVRFQQFNAKCLADLVVQVRDIVMEGMIHRQYDYASLMPSLFDYCKKKGSFLNLVLSCNYILEKNPIPLPNNIFSRRLNNLPERRYKIGETCFSLDGRETKQALALDIKWDAGAWPITPGRMLIKLTAMIDEVCNFNKRIRCLTLK